MKTEIESDPEGYLYIFGRMLKSEGYKVEHDEGFIDIEMEDSSFKIQKEESGFKVSGDTKKFVNHMKSVFKADNEEEAFQKLKSLGFQIDK